MFKCYYAVVYLFYVDHYYVTGTTVLGTHNGKISAKSSSGNISNTYPTIYLVHLSIVVVNAYHSGELQQRQLHALPVPPAAAAQHVHGLSQGDERDHVPQEIRPQVPSQDGPPLPLQLRNRRVIRQFIDGGGCGGGG